MTYEKLVDVIYCAILDVHDFGTSFDAYSQGVADELIKQKIVQVEEDLPMTNEDTEKVLGDRGNKYGSFEGNARTTQSMMDIAMKGETSYKLTFSSKEAIHMILHKISRIVNGDSEYDDNWVDIAGYAELRVKQIRSIVNDKEPFISGRLSGSN